MEEAELEQIHAVLSYAFADLDIEHYLNEFLRARERQLQDRIASRILSSLEPLVTDGVRRVLPAIPESNQYPFDTRRTLLRALHTALDEGGFGSAQAACLQRLQKKFEVFHRIFAGYDDHMRKLDASSWRRCEIYALLSLCMHLHYRTAGSFNSLNTGIKLNDLLLRSSWPMSEPVQSLTAAAALLELHSIRALTDDA